MPDGDGLDVLPEIVTHTRVLVLTADSQDQSVRQALQSGAYGYVTKLCGLSTLCSAVQAVASGEVLIEQSSAPRQQPAASERCQAR